MRLIDADALKEQFDPRYGEILVDICAVLDDAPTVDAEPVVHAHWETGYFRDRVCSHCTHPANDLNEHPFLYCPWCGAKMDEEVPDHG